MNYDDYDDDELTPEQALAEAVNDAIYDMFKALHTPIATQAVIMLCVTPKDDHRVFPIMAKALGVTA